MGARITAFLLIVFFSAGGFRAQAQRKLDLEDLNVKGELMNDSRLKLSARETKRMDERVKFRTHYRSEITEGLPRKRHEP